MVRALWGLEWVDVGGLAVHFERSGKLCLQMRRTNRLAALRRGGLGGRPRRVRRRARGRARRSRGPRRARAVAVVARRARRRHPAAPRGLRRLPAPRRRPPRRRLWPIYLAGEHRIDGQDAAAAGWLARARRLLAGEGAVPELGWLAIEEAKRAEDPAEAERHARAGARPRPRARRPRRRVHGARAARAGRRAPGPRRRGRGDARRGDDDRARRRGQRPAGLRRRLLHDAGRLRRPRRPQARHRVVRGGRRLQRATPLHPRAVVVPRHLRRGARPRGRLGARRGRPHRCAASAGRTRAAAAAACCPLAVLADLRLHQGREEEAERLLDGLEDAAGRACRRSRSCTCSAATSSRPGAARPPGGGR